MGALQSSREGASGRDGLLKSGIGGVEASVSQSADAPPSLTGAQNAISFRPGPKANPVTGDWSARTPCLVVL
jgi:hypothetical protein